MKEETKQFIVDKFAEKWIKENKDLLDDYRKICEELLFFRAKWGIEIGFIFKNAEEVRGRELGEGYAPTGMTEELFNAQETINKIERYGKEKFRGMTDEERKKAKKKPFFTNP